MQDPSGLTTATAPVAEIERRLQWRVLSTLVFLGILLGLAVVAVIPIVAPPRVISGLPDDPDVRAAADLVRGRIHVATDDLRFWTSLMGENPAAAPRAEVGDGAGSPKSSVVDPRAIAEDVRVAKAGAYLNRARARNTRDPRIVAALASLDLVRGRYALAEQHYRTAVDHGAEFGEARVGLGLSLALRAADQEVRLAQRSLLLEALAQFAAVSAKDPAYEAALYDRALLLEKVGRRDEARGVASLYLMRDSKSAWAERMMRVR